MPHLVIIGADGTTLLWERAEGDGLYGINEALAGKENATKSVKRCRARSFTMDITLGPYQPSVAAHCVSTSPALAAWLQVSKRY